MTGSGTLFSALRIKYVPNNSREIHTYVCAIDGHEIRQAPTHVWTTNEKCWCVFVCVFAAAADVYLLGYSFILLTLHSAPVRILQPWLRCLCWQKAKEKRQRREREEARRHTNVCSIVYSIGVYYYRHVAHVYTFGMWPFSGPIQLPMFTYVISLYARANVCRTIICASFFSWPVRSCSISLPLCLPRFRSLNVEMAWVHLFTWNMKYVKLQDFHIQHRKMTRAQHIHTYTQAGSFSVIKTKFILTIFIHTCMRHRYLCVVCSQMAGRALCFTGARDDVHFFMDDIKRFFFHL